MNVVFLAMIFGQVFNSGKPAEQPMKDCFGDQLPAGALMRLGTVRLRHVLGDGAITPKGDLLVSGGADNELRVWDCKTGEEVLSFRAHEDRSDLFGNTVRTVAISPNGDLVAGVSGCENCRIHLYSLSQRKKVGELVDVGMQGVEAAAFSRDGKLLACVGVSKHVFVWEIEGKKIRKRIAAWGNDMKRVAFSPDGLLIISMKDGRGQNQGNRITPSPN